MVRTHPIIRTRMELPELRQPVKICVVNRQKPTSWAKLGETYTMFAYDGFYANVARLDGKTGAARIIQADDVKVVE